MQLKPPPASLVAAFQANVERLTSDDGKVLLAVSGGSDSLAMLLLAHSAMPSRVHAATVDHGLRLEAADEAAFVASLCGQLAVPHSILYPEKPISGSMQASARVARYALLQAHAKGTDCAWIATAHHADDQLETVLMRIARGSGIDGLSAVRERRENIIRPLLDFRKDELTAICAQCGVVPVDDPSNRNASHDRVAMRQWLASTEHPFDAKRAVATALSFTEASEALDWTTQQLVLTRVSNNDGHWTMDPDGVPTELRRRLVLYLLERIQQGYTPRGEVLERALGTLVQGGQTMLGDVLCKGGKLWQFSAAPPRGGTRE